MSNRLTFSLASLVLIFALAFVAMPSLAEVGGPTVEIKVLGTAMRDNIDVSFTFTPGVTGFGDSGDAQWQLYDKDGVLLDSATALTPTADNSDTTTTEANPKIWYANNIDVTGATSIADAVGILISVPADGANGNLAANTKGNQSGSKEVDLPPLVAEGKLVLSVAKADPQITTTDGEDYVLTLTYTDASDAAAAPSTVPDVSHLTFTPSFLGAALLNGATGAIPAEGTTTGVYELPIVYPTGAPPVMIGVQPSYINGVKAVRVPPLATPDAAPPMVEIDISGLDTDEREFRIEVTITPQPKSDGSDGAKVVTTTGTNGFLMHIDAKDVREGTVLLSESAARGGDNMYTGILKYDRLATLPITLSIDPNDLVAGSKPDVDAVTATVGEGGDTPPPTNAPAKPAAPTAVTNATNDLSIDVSWTAPDDNGSAITGYTVRKYNSADELVKTFPDDDPNTNVITGTSYTVGPVPESDRGMFFTFTVAATNANGMSEESDKSVAYTVGAPSTWNLDVNRDGRVDVLDLVLVAVFHGTRMNGLAADVNADGIVNVQDFAAVAAGVDTANALALQAIEEVLLVAIAQAGDLEKAAEAPMRFNTPPEALSLSIAYENVTEAFIETRRIAVTDVRLTETVALLETLLMLLTEMRAIPETTALLPNYPNPFNPETWIPYHLATDADVTLTIYDVRGGVVRALTLGHQAVGVYESRSRAAYWDGKNQLGESVASGVYFYTLTAGKFTATRKMLIAK